jgi:hypothetical protein
MQLKWRQQENAAGAASGARHSCRFNVAHCLVIGNHRIKPHRSGLKVAHLPLLESVQLQSHG